MRLFFITPECPFPPNTGGRIVMWKRIEYLAKNNEVYLFSIIDNVNEKYHLDEMEKVCKKVYLYQRLNRIKGLIKSISLPYPVASRYNKQLKENLGCKYKENEPDLVIIEFPQMLENLPEIILHSDKIILDQHNIEFEALKSQAKKSNNLFKKIAYYFTAHLMESYEKQAYKKCSIKLYTFVSTVDKAFFEKKYHKSNTLLSPIGAEVQDFSLTHKSKHNIIFVAKMSYLPNENGAIWLINEVMPKILEQVKDAKLFLVGKDPGKILYEVAKNKPYVCITGTVESLEPYYEIATVAAIPIMSGGGVNVKLIEALGHNVCTVTTSKGIEGTELKNKEHVLVEDDSEAFSNACIAVLKKPENFDDMRERANKIVLNTYSWNYILSNYERKFREILNDN